MIRISRLHWMSKDSVKDVTVTEDGLRINSFKTVKVDDIVILTDFCSSMNLNLSVILSLIQECRNEANKSNDSKGA